MSEQPSLFSISSIIRYTAPSRIKATLPFTLLGMLVTSILLAACSSGAGGNSNTQVMTASLVHLHWCGGKPLMVFRDEGANTTATTGNPTATSTLTPANATPTTLTDWDVVKARLGFTVYLPTSLPDGTCLMSASGTLHDPIFGSSFTIGYLLPTADSISLSEAPVRMQSSTFQCSISANTTTNGTPVSKASAAKTPVQICTGVHTTTNIVFSARGTASTLKTFFQDLQPNVNWVPAS